MDFAWPIVVILLTTAFLVMLSRSQKVARAAYIRSYMFPPGLLAKLAKKRPGLEIKDQQLVARALRQFFLAHHNSGRKFVAMPSQIVDDLWHEFILYTRHYEIFCKKAFNRYMHHTPAAVLKSGEKNNEGLRRIWWYACLEENINPRKPTRLPLLFALDAKCNIPDGFRYTPNCEALRKGGDGAVYCGGDFANSSVDGSLSGFGGSYSESVGVSSGHNGCSSGSVGGCSGGCSGGCGGGCGS